MNTDELRVGMDVLARFARFGEMQVTAEHDQIWLHAEGVDYTELPRDYNEGPQYVKRDEAGYLDPAPVTEHEAARLSSAGWWIDVEVGSWSHYC